MRHTGLIRRRPVAGGAEAVAGDRLSRILARLSSGDDAAPGAIRLCQVCADVAAMSGAGIMLMSGDVPGGSVCTTNEVSTLIEELQYTLGEGPCVDAYRQDRPVLEPELADPGTPRWFAFTPPAVEAGVRAIFGFPLQVGAVRLGALNLYRDRPGPLSEDQYANALVLADVAARAVLGMQAQAPPGALAPELEVGANLRLVVHQASGMVAAQLGVSVGEALIRLRAYAFAHDRLVTEVAEEVVGRRLRFD
jgi:GAF domain-containing protein